MQVQSSHHYAAETDRPALRKVGLLAGWRWIAQGFALLRAAPLPLLGMTLCWLAIVIALNFIPLLGPLAATVFAPVLFGGFMLACHKLVQRQTITSAELFSARSGYGGALTLLGLVYLAALLLLFSLNAGTTVMLGLPAGAPAMPALLLLLSIPLAMAFWYAPALVVLEHHPPGEAVRLSFQGSWHNLPTFLLYFLLCLGLTALAAAPYFVGLLLWMPIALASAYAGYRELFADPAGQ